MEQKFYQVSAYENTFSKKTRFQEFTFAEEGLFEISKNKNPLKVTSYTILYEIYYSMYVNTYVCNSW